MRFPVFLLLFSASAFVDADSPEPLVEVCELYDPKLDVSFVDADRSEGIVYLAVKTREIDSKDHELRFVQCDGKEQTVVYRLEYLHRKTVERVAGHKGISPFLWMAKDEVYYFDNSSLKNTTVAKIDLESGTQQSVPSDLEDVQIIDFIVDQERIYALGTLPLKRSISVLELSIETDIVAVVEKRELAIDERFEITDYVNHEESILFGVETLKDKNGRVYVYDKRNGEYQAYESCGPSKFIDISSKQFTLLSYKEPDKAAVCVVDRLKKEMRWSADLFDVSYLRFGERSVFPLFFDQVQLSILDGGFGRPAVVHIYNLVDDRFRQLKSIPIVKEKIRDVQVRRHDTGGSVFVKYVKYIDDGRTETSGLKILEAGEDNR